VNYHHTDAKPQQENDDDSQQLPQHLVPVDLEMPPSPPLLKQSLSKDMVRVDFSDSDSNESIQLLTPPPPSPKLLPFDSSRHERQEEYLDHLSMNSGDQVWEVPIT